VLELLEKRVKSRFSHRQIHLCPRFLLEDYVAVFLMYLRLPDDLEADASFVRRWNSRVEVGSVLLLAVLVLVTWVVTSDVSVICLIFITVGRGAVYCD